MFQDVPERTLMRCSGENRRFPTKQNDHLEAAQASLSNLDTHSSCCSAVISLPRSLQQDPLVLEPIDREETATVRLAENESKHEIRKARIKKGKEASLRRRAGTERRRAGAERQSGRRAALQGAAGQPKRRP